jgi:hypothetical protein
MPFVCFFLIDVQALSSIIKMKKTAPLRLSPKQSSSHSFGPHDNVVEEQSELIFGFRVYAWNLFRDVFSMNFL